MNNEVEAIYNYLYWNEALSSSGKPTQEQLQAICQAGFEVLINLLPVKETHEEEASLVQGMGMEYIHIPVWWDSPERYDIQQFFDAMQHAQGKRVFVQIGRAHV